MRSEVNQRKKEKMSEMENKNQTIQNIRAEILSRVRPTDEEKEKLETHKFLVKMNIKTQHEEDLHSNYNM